MTFYNPSMLQSTLNSPFYAQLMQQMQGSGMMNQPGAAGQMLPNMAPQLPMATPQAGAGTMPRGGNPAATPQGGFFQQMMSSPQGMNQGVSGLTGLYGLGSGINSGLGSVIGTAAGTPLAGGAAGMGPTMGSGIMGAATGGSTGIGWLDSLLAFL
jgi:hypothetical protein